MNAIKQEFGIRFGLLNPSIAKQLKAQGMKYDQPKAAEFERLRKAIYDLLLGGLIVESQCDKLLLKLYNKILRHIGKKNGFDVKPKK